MKVGCHAPASLPIGGCTYSRGLRQTWTDNLAGSMASTTHWAHKDLLKRPAIPDGDQAMRDGGQTRALSNVLVQGRTTAQE
jgi:hypothetical protein